MRDVIVRETVGLTIGLFVRLDGTFAGGLLLLLACAVQSRFECCMAVTEETSTRARKRTKQAF